MLHPKDGLHIGECHDAGFPCFGTIVFSGSDSHFRFSTSRGIPGDHDLPSLLHLKCENHTYTIDRPHISQISTPISGKGPSHGTIIFDTLIESNVKIDPTVPIIDGCSIQFEDFDIYAGLRLKSSDGADIVVEGVQEPRPVSFVQCKNHPVKIGMRPSYYAMAYPPRPHVPRMTIFLEAREKLPLEYFQKMMFFVERFFLLTMGRQQRVTGCSFYAHDEDRHVSGKIYSAFRENPEPNRPSLHPNDSLLNYERNVESMTKLLVTWIDNYEANAFPNRSFFDAFLQGRNYGPSRLLSASAAIAITYPRGKLEDTTAQMYKEIVDVAYLPDIDKVIKDAISCRNYFVHGRPGANGAEFQQKNLSFFTDLFEYIYGINLAKRCGWSGIKWRKFLSTRHPLDHIAKDWNWLLKHVYE